MLKEGFKNLFRILWDGESKAKTGELVLTAILCQPKVCCFIHSLPPPPAKLFPVSICSFPRCWSPHVIIILYGVIMTFECSLKKTVQIYHTKHIWLNQSLDQISIKNIGTLIKESDNNEKRYLPLYCELKVLSSQCNSRWELQRPSCFAPLASICNHIRAILFGSCHVPMHWTCQLPWFPYFFMSLILTF